MNVDNAIKIILGHGYETVKTKARNATHAILSDKDLAVEDLTAISIDNKFIVDLKLPMPQLRLEVLRQLSIIIEK